MKMDRVCGMRVEVGLKHEDDIKAVFTGFEECNDFIGRVSVINKGVRNVFLVCTHAVTATFQAFKLGLQSCDLSFKSRRIEANHLVRVAERERLLLLEEGLDLSIVCRLFYHPVAFA